MKAAEKAISLHISLEDIDPPIWRRVWVPPDLTLGRLHDVIQVAIGWEDAHLHMFQVGTGRQRRVIESFGYDGDPGPESEDEDEVTVGEVLPRKGSRLRYLYDFGDSWWHRVVCEGRVDAEEPLPRCVAGDRAGPPEDCGGVAGYLGLLEDLAEEGEDVAAFEDFDIDEVNEALADLPAGRHADAQWTDEMHAFLEDPEAFGLDASDGERFVAATGRLLQAVHGGKEALDGIEPVEATLTAPAAGIDDGVVVLMESHDLEVATVLVFPARELTDLVLAEQDPDARIPTILYLPDDEPAASREDSVRAVPMPAVIGAGERLHPPTRREFDLLLAVISALATVLEEGGGLEGELPAWEGTVPIDGTDVMLRLGIDE